jgi:hypothetical protein
MPTRYCSQCGAKVSPSGAKFCAECGAVLDGTVTQAARWQLTPSGLTVFGFFVASGLAIWIAILAPSPPRPRPGATASPGGAAASNADLPEGHPTLPADIPQQAKAFIDDLSAKAKTSPDDIKLWLRLGQVDARAGQIDPTYLDQAETAFQHVLQREANNPDALRGMANIYYDRRDHGQAVPLYERYLKLRPEDLSARTDLGTMYLYAGNPTRAIATYQDALKRDPSFLQAHYNLAVTYHQLGNDTAALASARTARGLASEDSVRAQIDEMIVALGGPPAAPAADGNPPAARSPFQSAVEQAFRQHQIMGPKIVRFEWSGPAIGRVLMKDFPMEAMPPAVRQTFTTRLGDSLRAAQSAHPVEGPVRMEIADASSGTVMATVAP